MNLYKSTFVAALILTVIFLAGCDTTNQSVGSPSQPAVTDSKDNGGPSIAQNTPNVNWPTLNNVVAVDSAQAKEVEDAIKHADKVSNYTALTFDFSMLPSAYANESAVPPTAEQAKFIHDVIAVEGGAAAAELSEDGMLSYMKAWYMNWKVGAEAIERLAAKAAAEGRGVSGADIASITGVVGSPAQGNNVDYKVDFATVPTNDPYTFKEVKIEGNWADVTYDDGPSLNRVFLVKTAEGWKEAGLIRLKIHF